MESALLGVILDSSVLIAAERRQLPVAEYLAEMAILIGNRATALSSITVAELAHGIYRADTPQRRARRREFLDALKIALTIFPVTELTAELVGKAGGEAAARGETIPFDDLLIGATALEHGYGVLTQNPRHFRKIPGLTVLTL